MKAKDLGGKPRVSLEEEGLIFSQVPFFFFLDSGVQFITPVGPRQNLLLDKDADQHLWKSFIPHVYVSKPTTPIPLRLT